MLLNSLTKSLTAVQLKRQGFAKVDRNEPIKKEDLTKIYSSYDQSSSKLHPSLNLLWQRPKALDNFSESDSVWHCNSPLGKNTLGSVMKTISVDCKLSQGYTNHCIRSTAVSVLDKNNIEARHITCMSGHKSESNIRYYSRQLTESKTREISQTLTSACAQGSTEIVPLGTEVEQRKLNVSNVQNSQMPTHNFATTSSQETVHFHTGAFSSGCSITVNFHYH